MPRAESRSAAAHVLLVEDDGATSDAVATNLRAHGYRIATAGERKAIALWVTRRDDCFHAGTEYRLKTLLTEEQSYADSLFGAQRALSVQLLQGRMTYAQYNRYRFDLFQSAQYEAGYPAAAAAW